MIDEAFIHDHSQYEFKMASTITKINLVYFLMVYNLSFCADDDAESIAYVINLAEVINSDYLMVFFKLNL